MRDTTVFLQVGRVEPAYRPAPERTKDYRDVAVLRSPERSQEQASRCVNCAVPFCHWTCPLGNAIPDWNSAMAEGQWNDAYRALQATNNLPEVTGRVCPAPCEYACVLELYEGAVTIRENELAIVERAFATGAVEPRPPWRRTGKSVAVVGSGPAGLACADQLNQAGHRVVVFERNDKAGGILRYGIPDFKLEKWILDRRLAVWKAEGIEFETRAHIGVNLPFSRLRRQFDAVCLAGGSSRPRDLPIEGRNLTGIHFAMDFLTQSNRRVAGLPADASVAGEAGFGAGEPIPPDTHIDAGGKKVVVVGGGDTGADCVGTAHRQRAAQVVQIELLARPPESRGPRDRWPLYPSILRTSTSHQEGGVREWSVLTKSFSGENGAVRRLSCVRVDASLQEIPNTEFEIEADLVILAMGFLSPEPEGLIQEAGVALDSRGNVQTDSQHLSSVPGVFSAGDMRRGQSLVVHAIREGRRAAHHIDRFLTGSSHLPLL